MTRPRPVGRIALLLSALALIVLGASNRAAVENRLFFQPKRDLISSPADRGMAFTDVWFGPNRELHGWFIPGPADLTVLWLHGNGGNIGHRVEQLQALYATLGANFFLFDYHGYGQSAGSPSETTLYADARSALEYLRTRQDTARTPIVYFGKSLGAAVAVQLAVAEPPHRLVLQSGFTSVGDVIGGYFPGLGSLFQSRFPTLTRMGDVHSPVLLIHGDQDTVVPAHHTRELFEAASAPKCLLVIRGAGHDDLPSVGGSRYFTALRDFIAREPVVGSATCRMSNLRQPSQ